MATRLSDGSDEKFKALRDSGRPVTILVIGPAGVGKSTLINAMFGRDVAKVGVDTRSITLDISLHEGEYKGVKFKIYDTIGFRDTGGQSYYNILKDVDKRGQFDLILICNKLVDTVDERMFAELASNLNKEMWMRTVVVFTFANMFKTLESVKNSADPEGDIIKQMNGHKGCIVELLCKREVQKKAVLEKIPFCIAGKKDEKELPTVDDWLATLWITCIDRSSDKAHDFLCFYAQYRCRIIETTTFFGSVGAGAGIGAVVGSIVPGPGTIIGAGVGGLVGAGVSLVGIVMGRIFK